MKSQRRASSPSLPFAAIGSVLVLLLVLLGAGASTTSAGWNRASVTNSVSSLRTGSISAQVTTQTRTCTGSPATPTACAGQVLPAGPLQFLGVPADSTLANASPAGAASFTQSLQVSSCAPMQFANAVGSSPLLSRGGVARNVTDRWGTTTAARFDGVDDFAADSQKFPAANMATNSFTFGVWFRADPTSTGNSLVGGSSNPGAVARSDRGATPTLLLTPDNRVRFEYINSSGFPAGFSTAQTYRDGAWHLAVVVADRTATSTFQIWVDGVLAAQAPAVGLAPYPASEGAYWLVGWVDPSRAPQNTAPFFKGDLSGAFLISGTALSGAAIGALYSSTSAAAYRDQLSSATSLWMLGDGRTSVYTGAVPYVTGDNPCAMARVHPFSNGSALIPSSNLAALVTQSNGGTTWTAPVSAPGPGQSATLRLWASREASGTYDADVTLMEVRVRYAHRLQVEGSAWTSSLEWVDNYLQL